MVEIIGYLASALLAYSLVVTNALKFRWLNLAGCCFFILYGILISAIPVILANTILLLINGYQLIKLYVSKESFEMLPFEHEGVLLTKFLAFYKKDIDMYFPNFQFSPAKDKISFVVLRDLVIATIFVARVTPDGDAFVEINYTLDKYRDYKIGRFIFDREKDFLISRGVKNIIYENLTNKNHLHFIKIMGFIPVENGSNIWYQKKIA